MCANQVILWNNMASQYVNMVAWGSFLSIMEFKETTVFFDATGRKNMRKKRSLYIAMFIAVLLLSLFVVPALADAGNFSGDSSYGGSYSGSYSGDYGGSYSGSSGYYYSSSDDSSEDAFIGFGIILVVLGAGVLILLFASKTGSTGMTGTGFTNYSQLMPISEIKNSDPNFSEAAMKEKIANLYVRMQNAWQAKEFEGMRPFMTDALYSQFKLQLDELIRFECTNYVERIAVLDVELKGWRSDETVDAIVAIVNTRIVDYTTNDKTGMLVSGSKTIEKFMTYEWTLTRSKGMTTPVFNGEGSENTATIHCPSCGAPVEINQSAKCPYCDSVISAADYDWVISAVKGIAQRNG